MERFVIIVNGFQPLTIMSKRSILDVGAVLDPPLFISPSSQINIFEIGALYTEYPKFKDKHI